MQVLNNRDLAPPELTSGDSFRFTHPETMHVSAASEYYTWQERIRDHRKANNLPPISAATVEDQLCKQLPPEWCSHAENNRAWVNTRFSWGDIVTGAVAYVKLAVSGFQTVSQPEADRRARICAGCFLNVNAQGCGACGKMGELITGDIAKKKTQFDAALKACAACLCPNRATVHFPLEILEAADPNDEKQPLFTDFCWRKKSSDNYLPELAAA
jgi:hypothetical protein